MDNLSNDQIWNGAHLSLENAQDLYEIAEDLGKRGIYGAATSLMILSTEESSKCFGLLSYGINRVADNSSLRKYFRDHKHKHSSAMLFSLMSLLMEEMKEEIESIESDPNISPKECKDYFMTRMLWI